MAQGIVRGLIVAAAALAAVPATAQTAPATPPATNPQIDYAGFSRLTTEVHGYRAERLLDWSGWTTMAARKDALILDARSADAYAQGHIAGAINLPFTDFIAESLAAAIGPDRDRPILIYCNNNFSNDRAPVMLKARPLALNIQTFVNLYGYGYRNVWELNDVVDFTDPKVGWVSGGPAPARAR